MDRDRATHVQTTAAASSHGYRFVETDLDRLPNSVVSLVDEARLDEADAACEELRTRNPEVHDRFMRKAMFWEERDETELGIEHCERTIAWMDAQPADLEPYSCEPIREDIERLQGSFRGACRGSELHDGPEGSPSCSAVGGPGAREMVLEVLLEPVCRIAAESWRETQASPESGRSDRVAGQLGSADYRQHNGGPPAAWGRSTVNGGAAMQDRMAMTHEFAFALDSELCRAVVAAARCRASSLAVFAQRGDAAPGPALQVSCGDRGTSGAYAQRKLSWVRESCPVASLGPDGTIGFGELTGSDAEPYFSAFMQEPVPTPDSCPHPLSFALLVALEKDALSRVEALGCPTSTVIMRCIGDCAVQDSSLLMDGEQLHVSIADLEENKGLIVSETLDGMCFLEWTSLHMAFAYLAHTLALHDDPEWKPLDPSRDPDRWLHVEWAWSGEPGNRTRRSRILVFGEYWCAGDQMDRSGR